MAVTCDERVIGFMWYRVRVERVSDDGVARGSRVVLALAAFFFVACVAQAALTLAGESRRVGPLANETAVETP
ncbi:MAG: hypothetical protein AAF914_04480 [Pseudomonadota bacterium]